MVQLEYLTKNDLRFANKIMNDGYVAYRDYKIAYISKGSHIIKISTRCYNRLYLAGLTES